MALNRTEAVDFERELAKDIGSFAFDPLGHAIYAFPWGEKGSPLEDIPAPRAWQAETLGAMRDHLSNPETRFQPLRIAVSSGHGIGKSALAGMISKWGLDTCVDARIVITANTEGQLLTKTSPEVAKWHRMAITRDWFEIAAKKINSTLPGHEDNWRLDFVTWSEKNTEAFQGLHNLGRRIIVIMDEGSAIPDTIWEVIEGALTDENTELIWVVFSNPTRNTGRFRECFSRYRNRWVTRQIDSREVEGTNKDYLNELVDTYGENSDVAKVRVKGQFPSASSMQFIDGDTAEQARTREIPPGLHTDPVIFGVDCARFGDDHSTLAIRCGRDARRRPWKRWFHTDSMSIAGDIALEAEMWKPDAIFVDAGNIGAAIVDRLRQLKVQGPRGENIVFEVWFGGTGREAIWQGQHRVKTANKRSEIWTSMRAWLKGGAIPDEQRIEDDLTGVEYAYDSGETTIMLEKKAHMKKRGLASPDDGDALACTFAEPVAPRVPASKDPASYVRTPGGGIVDRYAEIRD